jgi:nucleoside-diphosphate-sugar epimerase
MPNELSAAGVRFHAADRYDASSLRQLVGDGADLLVDALCFTEAHAQQLIPLLGRVTATVMLSSKAVYVDDEGSHSNSDRAPRFTAPISESQPTMQPGKSDHTSREGYGENKVAAENVLLDSGHSVTVIRASKVHGAGAARPREWMFVKRVLDNRPAVFLAAGGRGIDHTTAAVNTAALIECTAAVPGRRILNSADPDAPSGREIARVIARHLGHRWEEILLADDAEPGLGRHPWDARPPIILDTRAALSIGYTPVGTFAQTVAAEVDWLIGAAQAGRAPTAEDPFFAPLLDYTAEDAYLRSAEDAATG